MMKFKTIFSLSLAAAFAVSLAACSGPSTPAPSPSSPTATSASPAPSGSPSEAPTGTASSSSATGTASNELADAKKAFPNLKVAAGENQDDVLLATYAAVRYVNNIYNSGYLANGSWANNGASVDELDKTYSKDWSDAFRAKVDGIVSDYHSSDSETQTKAQKDLMYYMFYTDKNMGNFKFPADCNQNNPGANSCLVGNQPTIDKEVTYQVNHSTGSIYVNVTFTDNVRVIQDGVEGVSAIHYDLQLEMIKNPYPDAQNLRYTYIVNDLGGNCTIDSWHKGA